QEESGRLPREHGPGELLEARVAAAGVAVARQIEQVERGGAAPPHAIDVGEPRLAGRGTRARDALSDQRVDQARLADIRAPDEGDLDQPVAWQVRLACGAPHEAGLDVQRERSLQTSDFRSGRSHLQSAI